jgi:hypothetical protein
MGRGGQRLVTLFYVVAVLLMLAALVVHASGQEVRGRALPAVSIETYRLDRLEEDVRSLRENQANQTKLLIGNLAAVTAAAVVHFFTGRRRNSRVEE